MNKEEIEKDDNYWKGYIEKQKEAEEICKMCNYRNKYKEVKEILDKVTEFVTKIATENAEKYNSENQKEVDFSEWNLALELLNIIEGGRNGKQRN